MTGLAKNRSAIGYYSFRKESCEKYQIKFSYMIDGEKLTGIKSGDIAAIFGNALDNAIQCAAELPVDERRISIPPLQVRRALSGG